MAPLTGGKLFQRGFTTNGKGNDWDPVRIAADASAIVSMRLRDGGLGVTVACSASASVPLATVAISSKIRKASIRSVVVVSETSSITHVLMSISGLTPGGKYQLSGRSGTCAAPGFATFTLPFTASAKGTALRDMEIDLGTAGSIDTGLVRLRNVQQGTLIVCRNLG